MSYAGRLVAMTGAATPVARPAVHEVVESAAAEVPASEMARSQPVISEPVVRSAQPPAPTPAAVTPPASEPASYVIHQVERSAPVREVTRIEPEAARPRRQVAAAPAHDRVVHEQTVVHDWLAERTDGADPLQSLSSDDEVRQLLRAVRGWTASGSEVTAPADSGAEVMPVIEIREPAALAPSAPVPQPRATEPRRDDPVQVSIGNVTITIEDAPAVSRRQAGATEPAVDVAGRLARHYLRGV